MNNNERFEQLWNDYLEGELHEDGIAKLQQLLASDDSLLRAAADSFQVHRLLGLKVEDSETRHEDFVRTTMGQLPSSETEFVGDVMQMLPVRKTGESFNHGLFRGLVAAALVLIVVLLSFRTSASPEVARITSLHGTVQWTGEGGIVQELGKVGEVLRGGTLETQSADAWADLTYRDGTTVTVSGRSLLTLSEQQQKIVRLRYGNISAHVAPQPTGRPMLVLTPSAELNVLGTQFSVEAQSESTRLVVNEERVRLKRNTDGKEVDVEAQHEITTSITHQDGLLPMQRAVAISVWKSDLESDVVYGKWVPELTALVAELKEAVAAGRMTKTEAVKAFKTAATLDDTQGSVWATHNVADHGLAKKYLLTGNKASQTVSYPEYGSVVSHEFPSAPNLPTYVSIDESFVGPGYLGSRYSPLTAEKPRHGVPYTVRGVSLEDGLTVDKYRSQKKLLDDLDVAFKGFEDLDDPVRGMDRFSEQAFAIISSPEARAAFDLSQEKASESDRFGKHEFGQSLLLAARLIEAGVHFVTVRLRPAEFDFDTHQENFSRLRTLLPPFDRGLAALLDRLEERGLLSSTAVMAAGEFGRTPKVNKAGGRDHWARAMCAVMAGGDVGGGRVIGETDAKAAEPASVGYSPDDLAASFFTNIGIAPASEFQSNVGRPITLVREGVPIRNLF